MRTDTIFYLDFWGTDNEVLLSQCNQLDRLFSISWANPVVRQAKDILTTYIY